MHCRDTVRDEEATVGEAVATVGGEGTTICDGGTTTGDERVTFGVEEAIADPGVATVANGGANVADGAAKGADGDATDGDAVATVDGAKRLPIGVSLDAGMNEGSFSSAGDDFPEVVPSVSALGALWSVRDRASPLSRLTSAPSALFIFPMKSTFRKSPSVCWSWTSRQ